MAENEKADLSAMDVLRSDATRFWRAMPSKALFFILLAAWLALFQFLGNSTLGYINTPSLFAWLRYVYGGDADSEHGMLIPFAVLGLFWWKREELILVSKRVWWPGIILMAGALLAHAAGYVVQVPQMSVVAFFGGLYALMGLVWGPAWLRACFFPMILFVFAVPLGSLGDAMTFPLRMIATNVTATFCDKGLGINLIKMGSQIFDPSYRFRYDVSAACGGIRSLIAMLALTTLYGFIVFKSSWRRILMILSSFPLAIAGNVFRLTSIIVTAEAFGQEAGMFVHDRLAILAYVPAIVGIILLGHWLREDDRPTPVGAEVKAT